MEVLGGLAAVIAAAAGFLWLYRVKQGDAHFTFVVDKKTPFVVEEVTDGKVVFSCVIPFVNDGTQDGTLVDVYPRHLLPYEYFDRLRLYSRLTDEAKPRKDDYWEAAIIFKKTGGAVTFFLECEARQGTVREALAEMFQLKIDIPVDVIHQVVSRGDWYITKNSMTCKWEEMQAALMRYDGEAQKGGRAE